jgi:hypothetical protein
MKLVNTLYKYNKNMIRITRISTTIPTCYVQDTGLPKIIPTFNILENCCNHSYRIELDWSVQLMNQPPNQSDFDKIPDMKMN